MAVQFDEINAEMRYSISRDLGCSSRIPWTPAEVFDGYMRCNFPGHRVYEAILNLKSIQDNLKENLDFAKKYMTPVSLTYNYAHKARAREVVERLDYTYSSMRNFKKKFEEAATDLYWNETINEWLAVYFIPDFDSLYEYLKSIKNVMKQNNWLPRPLPIKLKNYPDYV